MEYLQALNGFPKQVVSVLSDLSYYMQSINRFLYGPTPEERSRSWQLKLRAEQRHLEREMRQVLLFVV